MKRWIPQFTGIFVGLALGWGAAGWISAGWPVTVQSTLAADHVDVSSQVDHAHAIDVPGAAGAADAHGRTAANSHGSDHEHGTIDPAERNAWNLVPLNRDIPFLPYVLWGAGGLFLAALIVGPVMVRKKQAMSDHDADAHAADAHGHH